MNLANGMVYTADLAACRDPEFINEKLIRHDPNNNPIMSLVGSELRHSALSQSIGQLFLSGDRSSVGKSSMCLAILVSLLRKGVPPSALAYIKPVTQCEADQPVTVFCNRVGISNRGIGPVVFYKGFTRAYLNGETASAEALLDEARGAVAEISQGKMFTLVDGVGYPSVGSICNLSNADVAKKLNAPVLLVGKSGVGDAVDSYNLNSAYFELKGVRVLGGVFNKLPLDGYYSLDNCKDAVSMYFEQFKPLEMPYGFVPTIDAKSFDNTSIEISDANNSDRMDVSDPKDTTSVNSTASSIEFTEFETQLSDALLAHVDLDRLIHDVWMYDVSLLFFKFWRSIRPLSNLNKFIDIFFLSPSDYEECGRYFPAEIPPSGSYYVHSVARSTRINICTAETTDGSGQPAFAGHSRKYQPF